MDLATRLLKAFAEGPLPLRRASARYMYDLISRGYSLRLPVAGLAAAPPATVAETTFMNFGYHDDRFAATPLDLPLELDAVRYAVQLYHELLRGVDVHDRDVLEVGSGRGGGCGYVAARLGARSVTGVELSGEAVAFCQRAHRSERLRFTQGDAEDLPLEDASVDVVINLESSGYYPDFDAFLREVRRVLRPGGRFCWADARFADAVPSVDAAFVRAGFDVIDASNITGGVVRSLATSAPAKSRVIAEMPWGFRSVASATLAMPGSTLFRAMAAGDLHYLKRVMRAPGRGPA